MDLEVNVETDRIAVIQDIKQSLTLCDLVNPPTSTIDKAISSTRGRSPYQKIPSTFTFHAFTFKKEQYKYCQSLRLFSQHGRGWERKLRLN